MPSEPTKTCPACGHARGLDDPRCEGCGLPLTVLGKYRLEQRLGQGGMATVYGARRIDDGAEVAVKLMRLSDQEDWKGRELFERSSKVLRGLQHAQLPRVYDTGELDDGSWVLVRERFDGGTLESWIDQEHWRGTPAQIRALLESLLEVLAVLHERVPSVVHRDLKPSNVMFRHGPTRPLARNPPVLVDFDTVASAASKGETLVISPGYTAPEQLAGQSSPASDLYGLGMTMLRVVTHREPDALDRDEDGRVVLGSALDGLDPACGRVLKMMIEPDRRARPKSARWALEQLQAKHERGLARAKTTRPGRRRAVSEKQSPGDDEREPLWPKVLGIGVAAVLIGGTVLALLRDDSEPGPPGEAVEAKPVERGPAQPASAERAPPARVVPTVRCRGTEANCDGDPANGCETDLRAASAHCGECGHACGPDQRCAAGTCTDAALAIASSLYGYCELRGGGALWCGDKGSTVERVELPRPVVSFGADRHRCAVTDDGALYCWGDNGLGQAGTGSGRKSEPVPVRLADLEGVTAVSLGRFTGCAVAQGQAWCWGSSLSFGVIGSPRNPGTKVPIRVRGMDGVDVLRSGAMHVCVIRQGSVWCWGDGRGGATGDPSRPQGSKPTKIEGIDDATDLALGRDHTCALRATGTVACWGTNTEGQLGTGTTEDSFVPVPLELTGVVEVASDHEQTCARNGTGQVWCWGGSSKSVPTAVELGGPARFITMNRARLVAILEDLQVVEVRLAGARRR